MRVLLNTCGVEKTWTKKFKSLAELKSFYTCFIADKSKLVKVKSNPYLDEGLDRDNYFQTDGEDKLLEIINNDLQEAILEIEVIRKGPEIKQVDEVFVEINQSHISFQNMFNQISLKEICEEGLISISKQGSVSFENQQKSKSLLQRWYTPNVANKSGTDLS